MDEVVLYPESSGSMAIIMVPVSATVRPIHSRFSSFSFRMKIEAKVMKRGVVAPRSEASIDDVSSRPR